MQRSRVLSVLLPLLVTSQPALAGLRFYTSATVNSATSVYFDPADDTVTQDNGSAAQLSLSGVHDLAYSNGSGYTLKTTTDDVFTRASIEDGSLKTKAVLGFGIDKSGIPVPVGTRNGSSAATAEMADSFRAYVGSTPFAWTAGTKVHFAFDLGGNVSIPGTLVSALSSNNQVYSEIVVRILKPGGVDLYYRLQTFDFNAYPDFDQAYEAYNQLDSQYTASLIDSTYWTLAESMVGYTIDPAHTFTLDELGQAHLEYEFAPAGDFDWVMSMDSSVHLDASEQDVSVTLDFADTVVTGYVAPAGTTTYSASGLYPDTIADTEIPRLCGDANGDGKVSSSDALRALRAAVGGDPCVVVLVCDVDSSGSIAAGDALKILKLAVGQSITLNCGAST